MRIPLFAFCYCVCIAFAGGTVISNLNVIFETFAPLSMVRFFEFNDIGWNITEKCIKDMFLYLDGLHKDMLWAVKLYDASGYYSGSIYAGNNIRRGNPQLCRDLNNDLTLDNAQILQQQQPKTMYEEVQDFLSLSQYLPFSVQLVNVKYKIDIEKIPYNTNVIYQTVCLPKSCTYDDLIQVMSFANIPHLRNNLIVKNAELIDVKIINEKYRFLDDSSLYYLLSLTILFVFVGLIGTIYDNCTYFDFKSNIASSKRAKTCQATSGNNEIGYRNKSNNDLPQNRPNQSNTMKINPMSIDNVDEFDSMECRIEKYYEIDVDISVDRRKNLASDLSESEPIGFSFIRNILLAFSWPRNFRILFSAMLDDCVADSIDVAGYRFICLCWMLLVHVCNVLYYISDNKILRNNLLQAILDSDSLSIDTHFFLCGICVAHMFFNRLKNVDVENTCSCFDNLLHISTMIFYKYLGSMIPYSVGLFVLSICMKYFNDFSIIDIPSLDHKTCSTNMWRNIFYIDQFYPLQERCMIWSWILSLEMQFFIVACIVLLILKNHPRYGFTIFFSFFISSFIATTTLRFHDHHHSQKMNSSLTFNEQLSFFNGLHDQPWARLSPYFFGICMGYILHKTKEKLDINIVIMTCGWITSMFLLLALSFSKMLTPLSSLQMNAILSTLKHTIWCMILVWIIVASKSKHRGLIGRLSSSKFCLPFNKLTNCFIIFYPIITRIILLSSDGTFHLSMGILMTMYCGFVMVTFLSCFLIYIIYQAPIEVLLRRIYNKSL